MSELQFAAKAQLEGMPLAEAALIMCIEFVRSTAFIKCTRHRAATEVLQRVERQSGHQKMNETLPSHGHATTSTPVATSGARNQADAIIELVRRRASLFHDTDRTAYVQVRVDGHREVHALASIGFRSWIEKIYYATNRSAPSRHSMDAAIATLTAHAVHEGKKRNVHLRTASFRGKYYVDLADDAWRVVEIDAVGWRVLARSPVAFLRYPNMRPLPTPQRGRRLNDLRAFTNLPSVDRILIFAWLIECLRPETPYPGLALIGPQGSAKSVTQSVLRDLVDPSRENLRVKPRSVSDLFVAACNGHLLSYENLSHLSDEMQDGMCSILTGAAYGGRRLYTNNEESVVAIKRPIVVNGISQVVTRPDLLDRFVVIRMPPITENRRSQAEIETAFRNQRGFLFGALLTRFSLALRILPEVKNDRLQLPRMADFAQLGEAVARSLKYPAGHFIKRFTQNQRANVELAAEEHPVGAAILSYVANVAPRIDDLYSSVSEVLRRHWEGLPQSKGGATWPSSGKAFGDALTRLQGSLGQLGIVINHGRRTAKGYRCSIAKTSAVV